MADNGLSCSPAYLGMHLLRGTLQVDWVVKVCTRSSAAEVKKLAQEIAKGAEVSR